MSNGGGNAGVGFLKLSGIILVLMVIALGAIKYQEDSQDCRRGGYNVQCPAPPPPAVTITVTVTPR